MNSSSFRLWTSFERLRELALLSEAALQAIGSETSTPSGIVAIQRSYSVRIPGRLTPGGSVLLGLPKS